VALALVRIAAPVSWTGVVAALAVSASTHAVIDRRWPVQFIVRVKDCADWPQGPYVIDQSLHFGALLVAAVLAAVTASGAGTCAVVACAAVLVGAALVVERHRATAARAQVTSVIGG
jgi:hypothetical protein